MFLADQQQMEASPHLKHLMFLMTRFSLRNHLLVMEVIILLCILILVFTHIYLLKHRCVKILEISGPGVVTKFRNCVVR